MASAPNPFLFLWNVLSPLFIKEERPQERIDSCYARNNKKYYNFKRQGGELLMDSFREREQGGMASLPHDWTLNEEALKEIESLSVNLKKQEPPAITTIEKSEE